MTIHKVLITAALAVVVPVGASAQSATGPTRAAHECGMMAAAQTMVPGQATAATPAAEAVPMACCQARTAPIDHSAHTQATPPSAPGQTAADSRAAPAGATAMGCCGDKTTGNGDTMAAGKAGCCASMEGKGCCAPKAGAETGCCAHAQAKP